MTVILINPLDHIESIRYPVNRPPYELLYMDSYLSNKGVETVYMDIQNMKISEFEFKKSLAETNTKYYLINTTGRSHHFQNFLTTDSHIRELIKHIRDDRSDGFIIFSGEGSTVYVDKYLSFDVDCILYDEPEYGVFEIISKNIVDKEKLKDIKGIYYKENGKAVKTSLRNSMLSLDELPPPNWSYVKDYLWDSVFRERKEYIDIVAMRGCPYNCTFCKSSLSKKTLYHSPGYVLEQINILNKDFGYKDFFIRDSGYFDDFDRCQELCRGLEKINDIVWKCNARIDNMDSKKLNIMHKSGCSLVAYGVESGNNNTLNKVVKGLTTEKIRSTIKATKKFGIKVAAYMILGLPAEGIMDRIRSMVFARELKADITYINPYLPLRKFIVSGNFRKIIHRVKLSINILALMMLFWLRKRVCYYYKIRIDNIFQNLKHYSISQKKFRW